MSVEPFGQTAPRLGADVFVADSARVVGDVELGDHASVWFGCVIRGDVGRIVIGARTNVQDLTVVHVTGGVADTHIGSDVTIGHRAVLHGCIVEEGCLIGIGAVLLDGCKIGRGSVVGAGALVTPGSIVPPGSLVLGAPAKVKRAVTEHEALMGLEGASRYVKLARAYREMALVLGSA